MWHPLVETLVPIELALEPVYRLPLRDGANRLRAAPTAEGDPDAAGVAFETALSVIALSASARQVERLLLAYTSRIPVSVIRAISACPTHLHSSRRRLVLYDVCGGRACVLFCAVESVPVA